MTRPVSSLKFCSSSVLLCLFTCFLVMRTLGLVSLCSIITLVLHTDAYALIVLIRLIVIIIANVYCVCTMHCTRFRDFLPDSER